MADLKFDRDFSPAYGTAVTLAPDVRRVTCNNPGPFTFMGTNSYIVGHGKVAIIDPGPADRQHIDALMQATAGETITHILITHSHADHSPGARLLKERCGALSMRKVSIAPHALFTGMKPIRSMRKAMPIWTSIGFWAMEILCRAMTGRWKWCTHQGHTVNHLAFGFTDDSGLFCGDHAMAWSTSIVAPPDGSMASYMHSISKLMLRQDRHYWPGHGGVITNPHAFLAGLKSHREKREQALIARLQAGENTIPDMVATVYKDVDPSLHGAAALSMFAQMEYLVARGIVRCMDAEATLSARYQLV